DRLQAVDLVDEEHVALAKAGQVAGQSALVLDGGGADGPDGNAQRPGDEVREGGLAEARRAAEEHVVERLAAPPRRLDEDLEVVGGLALPDVLVERARAQGGVEGLLARGARRAQLLGPLRGRAGRGRGAPVIVSLAGHGRSLTPAATENQFRLAPRPVRG